MQYSPLCYVPGYAILRIGLLLSLLQQCHNASLPLHHQLNIKSTPESGHGGVEYSSSDRRERLEAAGHLPTPTEGPNLNERTSSSPTVYTEEEPEESVDELLKVQSTQSSTRQSTTPSLTTSVPLVLQSPTNVNLEFINESAVLITWSYPAEDHSHQAVHFLVRYSHDGDPYLDAAQPSRQRRYTFDGMLYGGYYQFQVVAIEGVTYSEPATTDYFINGITAPSGPPTNVRARGLSPSEIDLEWDGPVSPTPLLYLILWGENSTNLDKEKEVYQSTHVTFDDLEPGHTYYFQLRADISGRMSIFTQQYQASTLQIDLSPVHILADECVIHTSWIVVKWSKPSTTSRSFSLPVNSFTVYYRERKTVNPSSVEKEEKEDGGNNTLPLECGARGDDDVWPPRSDIVVPGDMYSVNITELQPGTTYVFCVGYSSGKFTSDWSASQELITLDGQNSMRTP